MTLQGNLRRAGTVSAGTVALLLGGGGLAFASTSVSPVTGSLTGVTSTVTDTTATATGTTGGILPTATPDPSSLTGTLTGTVGSTTSTVTGTLGSLLSSPSPSPLPPPVQNVVDTVSNTLSGLVQQSPVPTPNPLGGGTQGRTDAPKKATPTHSPKPTVKTAPAGPTAYEVPPEAYLALRSWTPPTSLGQMPSVAPANETAMLAAASAPQIADVHGDKSSLGIPHPPIGGIPGLLVILATIAVGAVAAGHVGVLQQRLGRTPGLGRHAAA